MQNKKMISERKAALLLGIHASTLMHWRKAGIIPVEYKEKKYALGHSRIKYPEEDFLIWVKTFQN